MVSHVAETKQSFVHSVSSRIISVFDLYAILLKAITASLLPVNLAPKSIVIPTLSATWTSFSVVLPAAQPNSSAALIPALMSSSLIRSPELICKPNLLILGRIFISFLNIKQFFNF